MADTARSSQLECFLAGVEATFADLCTDDAEYDDFMLSAEDFYVDYTRTSTVTAAAGSPVSRSRLPFWRYILGYSAAGLDMAAIDGDAAGNIDSVISMANELAAIWPFLPALVCKHYRDTPLPSSTTAGSWSSKATSTANIDDAGEDNATPMPERRRSSSVGSQSFINNIQMPKPRCEQGTQTDFEKKPFVSVHPEIPPVKHSFASQPSTPMQTPSRPVFTPTHSMSRSVSARTASTDFGSIRLLHDSPISTIAPPPLQFTASQSSVSTSSDLASPETSFKALMPPLAEVESHSPALLLADRGDNAAKLLPIQDGKYVLQVSIGGRRLVVNPERPSEISYHNAIGQVVTRSLISQQSPQLVSP